MKVGTQTVLPLPRGHLSWPQILVIPVRGLLTDKRRNYTLVTKNLIKIAEGVVTFYHLNSPSAVEWL